MSSPGSCSRCNRPLPAESDSQLCAVCLRSGADPAVEPASTPPDAGEVTSSLRTSAPPALAQHAATAAPSGIAEPASSAERWVALFQTPRADPDQTRSHSPDGTTDGFPASGRDRLPEPPPGYALIRPLGSGGWGSVYLAHEQVPDRTVAIKFLHAPSSASAFERFRVEVQSLAKLDHPNVIKVIAVEANWREPFLTMEYAGGGTLADLAKPGGPLPTPAEAARLMLGAAEGVAAAHAAGILHRDIKPSNILLQGASGEGQGASPGTPAGSSVAPCPMPLTPLTPKVSDFGLAKRTDRDDGLTRTGPLGTPCYMSPEAAAGRFREVGPAADVYGLGATLYSLLTGRPPFLAESTDEILRGVMNDPPERVRRVRPEVPAELEAIVTKAMEKDPARRYPTAAALAADLRRFLEGQRPVAPVQSPRRRAWRWLARHRAAIAVGLAVAVVAVGLIALGQYTAPLPQEIAPAPDRESDPTPLEAIRADLRAGKPAPLIGDTGLPRHQQFWLEASGFSALGNQACEFRAFDTSLLELAPDLGVDRYEVKLELQHVQAALPAANQVATDSLAFYFGHAAAGTPAGATAHALFAVSFKDYEPPAAPGRPRTQGVHLMRRGFIESPQARPKEIAPTRVAALSFTPKPSEWGTGRGEAGEWRPIVASVSPAGVHIQWRADDGKMVTLVKWTGDQTRDHYQALKKDLDAAAPGAAAALPGWSPRMPLGVLAYKSKVRVRNVTVTPLPPAS